MDEEASQPEGLTMVSCHFCWVLVSTWRVEGFCINVRRYNKMDGVSVRTLSQARLLHPTSSFLSTLSLVSWVVWVNTSPPVFFKAFITSPVLCHPLRGSRTCLLAHTHLQVLAGVGGGVMGLTCLCRCEWLYQIQDPSQTVQVSYQHVFPLTDWFLAQIRMRHHGERKTHFSYHFENYHKRKQLWWVNIRGISIWTRHFKVILVVIFICDIQAIFYHLLSIPDFSPKKLL